MSGMINGIRIKIWVDFFGLSEVINMIFQNIIMSNVINLIIIDQFYCFFFFVFCRGLVLINLVSIILRDVIVFFVL